MKKYITVLLTAILSVLSLSLAAVASAHEHDAFQIGDKQYQFVVGSLNEPVVVDDKTGVDLTLTSGGMPTMGPDGDMDGPPTNSVAITGLEKTLKVEISAGDKKQTFDLVPAYGKPGGYYATFYPTVQTTFAYRFFGTVDNNPVDITFNCNPAPSSVQGEDKTAVQLSDKVRRISKAGAFGCPLAKANLGFPEPSVSNNDLAAKVNSLNTGSSKSLAVTALVLSVLAIAYSGYNSLKK